MPEKSPPSFDPIMMLRIEEFARRCGVGRTIVFRAANPNPDYRRGLPFLPTVKLGRCRGVRPETAWKWLAELERVTLEQTA